MDAGKQQNVTVGPCPVGPGESEHEVDCVPCAQIRNGQLDKEARELRAENSTLQESVEHAKHAVINNEMVRDPTMKPCSDPQFIHHMFSSLRPAHAIRLNTMRSCMTRAF
jgi:hypothetical protein